MRQRDGLHNAADDPAPWTTAAGRLERDEAGRGRDQDDRTSPSYILELVASDIKTLDIVHADNFVVAFFFPFLYLFYFNKEMYTKGITCSRQAEDRCNSLLILVWIFPFSLSF